MFFGIIGVWLLSCLALISQIAEFVTFILVIPGRMFSHIIAQDVKQGSDLVVVVSLIFNGLVYGLIGILLQIALRKSP